MPGILGRSVGVGNVAFLHFIFQEMPSVMLILDLHDKVALLY